MTEEGALLADMQAANVAECEIVKYTNRLDEVFVVSVELLSVLILACIRFCCRKTKRLKIYASDWKYFAGDFKQNFSSVNDKGVPCS